MPQEINKCAVNNTISLRKEVASSVSLSNSQISYTLADRTAVSVKYGNYFTAFNIPHIGNNQIFYSGGSVASAARAHPELFQLNVDKIVIIPIGVNHFNEYIDGRSITLTVPQWGGTSKTVISSFYSDEQRTLKKADSPLPQYFGPKNVAFLFSNDINTPYTGTSNAGAITHNLAAWNPTTDYRDRPSAVAYSQLETSDLNTDTRAWTVAKKAVAVNQAYPKSLLASQDLLNGYNYDIPVGFVCLDKGFIILTHPEIINDIPWTSGSTSCVPGYDNGSLMTNDGENVIIGSNAGATSATTSIVFTSTTSTLNFVDMSVRYMTSVLCIAMPKTFFISKNPTWPLQRNLIEASPNGNQNFDSIFVTQIGLYNAMEELIAVAKLDRPVEKTYDNIMTFNLEIDV